MSGILELLFYSVWQRIIGSNAFIQYLRDPQAVLPPSSRVKVQAGDSTQHSGGPAPAEAGEVMFKHHHHRDRDTSSGNNSNSNSSLSDGAGYYANPGINNLGNSCFLNSVIQGLAASRPLRDALAAYPGAERVLKAGHTSSQSASSATRQSNDAANPGAAAASPPDSADIGEIDRISAVADQQRQGLEKGPSSPSALAPGTPTTETSPSLQLLTEDPFPDSLPLSSALASTLVKLWSGKQSTINVKNLMRELNKRNEDWNEWDQMDAHELLRFLLDGVSMEEIDLIKKLHPQPASKTKQKNQKRKGPRPVAERLRRKAAIVAGESISSSESDDSSSDDGDLSSSEAESLLAEDPAYRLPAREPPPPRYTPFIDTIFGGKLASVIVCEECRGVSRIEEDFLDISLPIKGDDGKVRRRDRLRKFLGSSSNLSKESERPKLAPRAPTNILNLPESEVSESEDGGAASALEPQSSSNASISSGGAGTSASSKYPAEKQAFSSKEETEDQREAGLRRRKSLDPASLRAPSPRRGFLSTTKSGEKSSLSRGASPRVGGSNDSSKTFTSDKSRGSDISTGRKKSKHAQLLAKPTKEQQEYIRQLFAEIPLPSNNPSPLAQLRIAQPGGQHTQYAIPTPTAAETNGSPLAMSDATETGVYQCLVQFTSVELLDGENAFQCRRCWKLLHPELVAQVGRKRAAKALQKKEEAENKQLLALKNRFPDDTPRASITAGSDSLASRNPPGESMIAMNRKLLAERERQLVEASGIATASTSANSTLGSAVSTGTSISQTPDIMITANSPPVSPPGSSEGPSDPLHTAFASLSTSKSRISSAGSSAPSTQRSLGLPSSSMSDAGAEADEEDRSDLSDVEQSNGDMSAGAAAARSSPDEVAERVKPSTSNRQQSVMARPNSSRMPVPSLPPRSQRFVPRRAHKRYLISSLPPILVLHLKRFQQTHKSMFSSFGDLKKLDDKITFPLYLDMAPFMAPPPLTPTEPSAIEKALASGEDGVTSGGSGSSKSGDERDNNVKSTRAQSKSWFRRSAPSAEMRSNCVYRLYAVIVHKGSMGSGHYVAMTYTSQRKHEGTQVKAPAASSAATTSTETKTATGPHDAVSRSDHKAARQWIYCSDDIVRPASVDEVFKSQAYLLMYERVDPSEILPSKM